MHWCKNKKKMLVVGESAEEKKREGCCGDENREGRHDIFFEYYRPTASFIASAYRAGKPCGTQIAFAASSSGWSRSRFVLYLGILGKIGSSRAYRAREGGAPTWRAARRL